MAEIQATTENSDVCELVRKAEKDYTSGVTTISKYVQVSQYENLNIIDAYLNSKHISGDVDSQGREKPFFNIVTAAVNVWYRATDIDRKNIKIKPTKSLQDILAFLATVRLQNWMRSNTSGKNNFGVFLNKWGRSLAKYGSAVVKFVEKYGKLHCIVVPWNRLIVDTIDFDSNPVVEKLEFTPAQLRKKKEYDQVLVEKLIAAKAARKDLAGMTKDNKSDYIEVFEVHGELPLSYKTGKESDEDTYKQQMHVVSFVARKEEGEFDDFTLFSGIEAKDPYMITHLIEEDDQTLSIGAVQNLFDSQWMVNHSVKNIKDQLDLASKIIFQTSDGNFVGQNALTAIEQGDILVHADNKPLTQVANNSHDIASNQNFAGMWQQLGNQINGISEAMLGINPKSGTAWRQTEALLQESQSLFEVMTENKGLYIEQMMREYIIPFVKKGMDSSEEIGAILDSYHIDKIDSMYVPNEAIRRHNAQATEAVLNGQQPPDPSTNVPAMQDQVRSQLSQLGNTRFFKPSDISEKTWKSLLNNFEWECEVDVTGEQKDTQAVMDTLNTLLKFITQATPEQLNNPNFKLVFNKILEETSVISPIEIASLPPTPPTAPPPNKVSEAISFKDLPPDGQQQMAKQAGIDIAPPTPVVPAPTAKVKQPVGV